jgi:hypothetical protein
MGFSPKVSEDALVASGRCCSLCHRFCGTKMQLHHIVPTKQGGSDKFDNCIPLCLECHAEVENYNPVHPIGRRFTPTELKGHRDRWYLKVANFPPLVLSAAHRDVDRRTFAEIMQALPSDGPVQWVRGLSFIGAFSAKGLAPLVSFGQEFLCRADKEFIDADIEAMRGAFIRAVFDLNIAIMQFTIPTRGALPGNEDLRECPPFPRNGEDAERVQKAYSRLRSCRDAVLNGYDGLVRAARGKLAC